jgi:predicted DNA-binding transcriptional regulator AlpA
VTTDVEDVTDDQLDELVDALAPVAGAPSMHGGRLSVQLNVVTEHPRLADATEHAEAVIVDAMRRVGLATARTGRVVGVEVLEQAEFNRRIDGPPRADDLIPTADAAQLLDVSRQRISQLAEAFEDFPRPVKRGRVLLWPRSALFAWRAGWDRSPGPKRSGRVDSGKPS